LFLSQPSFETCAALTNNTEDITRLHPKPSNTKATKPKIQGQANASTTTIQYMRQSGPSTYENLIT